MKNGAYCPGCFTQVMETIRAAQVMETLLVAQRNDRCASDSCGSRSGAPGNPVSSSDLEELAWLKSNHLLVPLIFETHRIP
jgi:hypothetical protein